MDYATVNGELQRKIAELRELNTDMLHILESIEGVVVSLTDISALERVRVRLRQMSVIVESLEEAIIGTTLDGTITSWNRGDKLIYGDVAQPTKVQHDLGEREERREEFLAMLSHELRNPLSAVVSAATVMRSPDVKLEVINRARQIAVRQSRRMARLLDDLLDVTRITRGGIWLRKEDLDLRDVIRTAIESLTPVLEERQSQLYTDLQHEVLPVRGDSARAQQVVVNLLSNAARYSPPGGPIYLSAAAEGESIVLKVKDQGRGISPSMLADIFEPFVQDGQGIERSMGGLGIGLTLVRQIVELHGGEVHAHSDGPGKGSEFVVRFPRQSKRRKQAEASGGSVSV